MNWNIAILDYIRQHPHSGHCPDVLVVLNERAPALAAHLPTGLPLQLCQGMGGEPERAVPLSAAFTLFNLASEVLDDFQDQDTDFVWAKWPLARVTTTTLALVFLAQSCLGRLEAEAGTKREILDGYAEVGILAAVGQNSVAEKAQPSLQGYWHHIQAKTGLVCAVGAWSGARLATADADCLDKARAFGLALGTLAQIADDCRDFQTACEACIPEALWSCLPVIIAHQKDTHPAHPELMDLLQLKQTTDPAAIYQMVTEMGGVTGALALGKAYEHKALTTLTELGLERCELLVDYVRHFLPTT